MDPSRLAAGLPWILLLLGLIVMAKVAVAWAIARVAKLDARPIQLAVGLGQIGEFSFVLASAGLAAGAIDAVLYVAIIASVALSIAVSSVVVRLVPPGVRREPAPAVA